MSKSSIRYCSCTHPAQDKMHGQQMRVHNFGEKSDSWRCTVCGDKKNEGAKKK